MNIIITTPEEFRHLIREELGRAAKPTAPAPKANDKMLLAEAIEYLAAEHRVKYSTSTIYKNISLGRMPARRLAGRLVFSKLQLDEWVAEGMPSVR